MKLTKEQLTKRGLRRREVTIPDTADTVFIRELSASEVRDYGKRFVDVSKSEDEDAQLNLTADLVIRGVVDEQGNPLFSANDIASVKEMSVATIAFLANEISALSGMSADTSEKKDAGTK